MSILSPEKGNSPFSISQNFLTSRKLIEAILRKTNLQKEDTVLEIGAGKGHITKALAQKCRNVVSYEIDPALYYTLKPALPPNVKLYLRDFLKAPLPETPYKVFANIPFSQTTSIVRRLTEGERLPEKAWLILEKGAAKRFCGHPKETSFSLCLRPYFNMRILHFFRREDFHPAPRVDVVLLEFAKKPEPDIPLAEQKAFQRFVRYSQKYGLWGSRALLTKKQVSTALRLAGLPGIAPSGDILYVQWLCLFRCWLRFGRKIGR